ncbi:MAG TPA: mechanosensitive ion channel domain-containing protein, partial [Rhizobacter sp.]|nr:mechanosensitive ion channel domain-containing protein [Rhizobacter sp.]
MYMASIGSWWHIALLGLAIVFAAQVAHRVSRPIVIRIASHSPFLTAVVRRCDSPLQWLVPLAAWQIALQGMPQDLAGLHAVEHLSAVTTIAVVTWLVTAAIRGVSDGMIALHPADTPDNLAARRIQTQTRMLARMAVSATLIAGLAFILMTFPQARQLGVSLLASAGLVGVIAGVAARSVFSNLLAGLQIALAQPIRIDDVLIVEGEWGRVEEITATYVVIKVWDERRLIVPLAWFIEHPFQNWTRRNSDILGTVFLWVD